MDGSIQSSKFQRKAISALNIPTQAPSTKPATILAVVAATCATSVSPKSCTAYKMLTGEGKYRSEIANPYLIASQATTSIRLEPATFAYPILFITIAPSPVGAPRTGDRRQTRMPPCCLLECFPDNAKSLLSSSSDFVR